MKFKDIIGQENGKNFLLDAFKHDRVPHAQLFLGPEGSGTLPLALAFAQYIFCENPSQDDSCGECPSCGKVSKLIHPDLHFSFPTIESKLCGQMLPEFREAVLTNPYLGLRDWLEGLGADNKQGNIYAKECDDIMRRLSLKSFEGKSKVQIIWMPELLGHEGNKLLKIIEEPPADTYFLLVGEQQELILNTILSRCQLVKVYPLSAEEIKVALADRGVADEKATYVAFMAGGSFSEAKRLLEDFDTYQSDLFVRWLRANYAGKPAEMSLLSDILAGTSVEGKRRKFGRNDQKNFLSYGLHFLRESLVILATGRDNVNLPEAEVKVAKNLTYSVLNFQKIDDISSMFDEAILQIERNANPKILFLNLSIKLHKKLRG